MINPCNRTASRHRRSAHRAASVRRRRTRSTSSSARAPIRWPPVVLSW